MVRMTLYHVVKGHDCHMAAILDPKLNQTKIWLACHTKLSVVKN